jgi:hypothetical protein
VRDIRSIYDQARREVDKIVVRRKEKEKELEKLGGAPMTTDSECSKYSGPPSVASLQKEKKNEVAEEYFRQAGNTTLANVSAASLPPPPIISVPTPPQLTQQAGHGNFVPQQQHPQQVQAAPISAPLPSYGSNSVAYQDPFAPTTHYGGGPSAAAVGPFATPQQQQQPVVGNGNNAFGYMNDDSSNRSYGSSSYGGAGMPAMGTGSVLGLGGVGPAAGAFGVGFMSDDSQRSFGSYGPAMGTGPAMGFGLGGGPTATMGAASNGAAAAAHHDPFAAFDMLQQPTPPQQQQSQASSTDNPLFRY